MLRSHVVFAAFSFCLTPVVVALPQVLSERQDRTAPLVTMSPNEAVSAPEGEDVTEEEKQLTFSAGLSAEAYPAGPGSTCNKSSHCVGALVCAASGACACPESRPVLLGDTDNFACVLPRRLSEPCVNHIECSHATKHARCVDSMCRCPADFVTASDGSTCLSESVLWHPMATVLFPAVLLILAFVILASYGYYRLKTPDEDKHQDSASTLVSHGANTTQRLRKWFEGWNVKRACDGIFSRSRIRSFIFRAFQGPNIIQAFWQSSKYDRFGQESDHAEYRREDVTPMVAATNRSFEDNNSSTLTTHAVPSVTLNRADIPSLCPVSSMNVIPREGCTEAPKQDQDRLPGQHVPATVVDDRLPVPKRRTKISTLSTSTMMPCRAMRRRQLIRISNSPAIEAPTVRTACWQSGLNVRHQAAEEDYTEKDARLPQFQAKSVSLLKFTESELFDKPPKRFKSEGPQKPGKRRLRRTASEDPHRLAEKAKEGTAYSSSSSAWSMAPHIPSSESLRVSTELYTGLTNSDKTNELVEDWGPLPTTFPPSAFRHGACKHVDRRQLAWNTFTVHNEYAPPDDRTAAMTNMVANAAAHRGPLLAPYISSPRPPTAGKTRYRRGPLTYGAASPAVIFAAPRSSTGFALSDVASGGRTHCNGEVNGRKSPFPQDPTDGPISSVASCATQLINSQEVDRGSASLDSALLAAIMRADRRVEGSYF